MRTDGYTHDHSERVARYATALATHLGTGAARVEMIRRAGLLHDVGKMGVPDALLAKPGRLTAEEYRQITGHSQLGAEIVAGAGLTECAPWILHLHERWDGHGYPAGLAREQIPLESRILSVADALEAVTSSRTYRQALSVEEVLFELEVNAGTQFDPATAAAIADLVRRGTVVVGTSLVQEGDDRQRSGQVAPAAST